MKMKLRIGCGLLFASGALWAQQYLISTVAGGGAMPFTPSPAVSVGLPPPAAVAVDSSGNVYFCSDNFIFKLAATGTLTRVAGTGKAGYSGDGGPATSARINLPQGLAFDGAGNLYIADTFNNSIRKVTAAGVISTVAGTGVYGSQGDNGAALSAQLASPYGVAVDSAGANIYIADTGNSVVRKVSGGTITAFAGNYISGYVGNNVPATLAELASPQGVALDGQGDVLIADTGNNIIREVNPAGTITTIVGDGTQGYIDNVAATSGELNQPFGVTVDGNGNIYIADAYNTVVREVSNGIITTVAGNGYGGFLGDNGPATSAELDLVVGVAVANGNLYIADYYNCRIRKVASGTISTVAGDGDWPYQGDGGPATQAEIREPWGVVVDSSGNLYIADSYNCVIRMVSPSGTITTVVGTGAVGYTGDGFSALSATLNSPTGLALDSSGNLYIADTGNNVIRKVSGGIITTVAGNGTGDYGGDGQLATEAYLYQPGGVAVDGSGDIFIADTGNNVIREVGTNGIIETVVGDGYPSFFGDGGPATSAELDQPFGVAFAGGNLYIADSYNYRIREVTPNGNINTVAGNGTSGSTGNGGQATNAELTWPTGIMVDSSGNLYIADYGGATIRKVSGGTISTIAGSGVAGYAGDGGPATLAELEYPTAMAMDAAGNIYFGDTDNNVVRMLVAPGAPLLTIASAANAGFVTGGSGATYTVLVGNAADATATSGMVTVTEIAPTGLTPISMAGTGWSCSATACSRSDALAAGASYPPITVTVGVAVTAQAFLVNEFALTGGGSVPASAGAPTTIASGSVAPAVPELVAPANGALAAANGTVLTWNDAAGATSYDVYFGTAQAPPMVTNTTTASYSAGSLSSGATYYWQIVARNSAGTTDSAIWSFTAGAAASALEFIPVPPCRVADTRNPGGPFGGPEMAENSSRSFTIPASACNIPSTAQAYSLNVTVVPDGVLQYLTLWPTGENRPYVSTLNSFGGLVVANAAIVPAGTGGAVSVYVTDPTHVILDINGYFDSPGAASAYSFYPATPCRIADTRQAAGTFGGPSMTLGETRSFPIPSGPCDLPSSAAAYSLNVTVVPTGYLGYLTTWPTGQNMPGVSTLNSWTGKVVANAALVPAGTNGAISVYVTNPTDVILDTNGYFATPGSAGALNFYPMAPCRIADTRNPQGAFGGPSMGTGSTRSFIIPASACPVPASAAAYSLNVTVVPHGGLQYLTIWPAGSGQPYVSTLNSFDGSVVANAAIVPAGVGGAISVYVTDPTDVILDINGYFAP